MLLMLLNVSHQSYLEFYRANSSNNRECILILMNFMNFSSTESVDNDKYGLIEIVSLHI